MEYDDVTFLLPPFVVGRTRPDEISNIILALTVLMGEKWIDWMPDCLAWNTVFFDRWCRN